MQPGAGSHRATDDDEEKQIGRQVVRSPAPLRIGRRVYILSQNNMLTAR